MNSLIWIILLKIPENKEKLLNFQDFALVTLQRRSAFLIFGLRYYHISSSSSYLTKFKLLLLLVRIFPFLQGQIIQEK